MGCATEFVKLTGLMKEKFPDQSKPNTLPDPISAGFRMRISVDTEGACRTAHRQYFGISCWSDKTLATPLAHNPPCQ